MCFPSARGPLSLACRCCSPTFDPDLDRDRVAEVAFPSECFDDAEDDASEDADTPLSRLHLLALIYVQAVTQIVSQILIIYIYVYNLPQQIERKTKLLLRCTPFD